MATSCAIAMFSSLHAASTTEDELGPVADVLDKLYGVVTKHFKSPSTDLSLKCEAVVGTGAGADDLNGGLNSKFSSITCNNATGGIDIVMKDTCLLGIDVMAAEFHLSPVKSTKLDEHYTQRNDPSIFGDTKANEANTDPAKLWHCVGFSKNPNFDVYIDKDGKTTSTFITQVDANRVDKEGYQGALSMCGIRMTEPSPAGPKACT